MHYFIYAIISTRQISNELLTEVVGSDESSTPPSCSTTRLSSRDLEFNRSEHHLHSSATPHNYSLGGTQQRSNSSGEHHTGWPRRVSSLKSHRRASSVSASSSSSGRRRFSSRSPVCTGGIAAADALEPLIRLRSRHYYSAGDNLNTEMEVTRGQTLM